MSARHLAILIFLLTAAPAMASWPQVASYSLDVTFEPEQAHLTGFAQVQLTEPPATGDTVQFALHGEVWVDSIQAGGHAVSFSQHPAYYYSDYSVVGNIVSFVVSEEFDAQELDIYYDGYFHRSRARSPSDYMRIDETGVYLRSYGYSLWFPVFLDYRQQSYTVDFERATVRVPAGFTAVFTGELLETRDDGNYTVSVWQAANVDLFDAQCTARRYTLLADGPYRIYHMGGAESTEAAKKIMAYAQWLTGRYAERYDRRAVASQYHIMEMPRFGDISSGNVTGVSTESWHGFNESSYTGATLAHELVHPFVSPPIDQDDPLFALVIEGFPSCFDSEVMAERLGAEWFREQLDWVEKSYLKKRETGLDRRGRTLPAEKPLDRITAGEVGTYKDRFILGERTMLFFHYLAVKMGPERYRAFQRRLFDAERLTDSSFRALVEEFLPEGREDLRVWLSTTEYPDRFRLANL